MPAGILGGRASENTFPGRSLGTREIFQLGVDGVFSDFPNTALAVTKFNQIKRN